MKLDKIYQNFESKIAKDYVRSFFGNIPSDNLDQGLIDKYHSSQKPFVEPNAAIPEILDVFPELECDNHHKSSTKDDLIIKTNNYNVNIIEEATIIEPSGFRLEDINSYSKSKGIVNEFKNSTLLTLSIIYGINTGLEGPAGSGKTMLADSYIGLVDNGLVYTLNQSSGNAVMYNVDEMNPKRVIYIPEIQKMVTKSNNFGEILKDITEGKNSERIVTNKQRNGTDKFILEGNKTIIYTKALENEFKLDKELARRFNTLRMNNSAKQIERIINTKARNRFYSDKNSFDKSKENNFKNTMNYLINKKHSSIDPYYQLIQNLIPITQKSVSNSNHYIDLIDASSKAFFNQRLKIGDDTLISLFDHYLIFKLNHDDFLESLVEQGAQFEYNDKSIDWGKSFDEASVLVKEHFPDKYDEWVTIEKNNIDRMSTIDELLMQGESYE